MLFDHKNVSNSLLLETAMHSAETFVNNHDYFIIINFSKYNSLAKCCKKIGGF